MMATAQRTIDSIERTISIAEKQVKLICDGNAGIGGFLWTAGLLLTKYIENNPKQFSHIFNGKRVLELGSGTGLVGISLLLLTQPSELVLTDLGDHMKIIQQNISQNLHLFPKETKIEVQEYEWGSKRRNRQCCGNVADSEKRDMQCGDKGIVLCLDPRKRLNKHILGAAQDNEGVQRQSPTVAKSDAHRASIFAAPFEVVIGTEVVYHASLYSIFIESLVELTSPSTTIILGINRQDTGPQFFSMLNEAGFRYKKVPQHNIERETQKKDFAIFFVHKLDIDHR